MPRKAVTNPNQFKLFMTGVEWQESVDASTDGPIDRIWEQKEREAKSSDTYTHGAGTYESLKTHGYQADKAKWTETGLDGKTYEVDDSPRIILEDSPQGNLRKVQSEGHHRIAAAAAIERETGQPIFIPTNYVDNTAKGREARRAMQMHRLNEGAKKAAQNGI